MLPKTQPKHIFFNNNQLNRGPERSKLSHNQKGNCQSRKIHFYNRIDDHFFENTTKTRNLITTINRDGPQNESNDLANQGTRRNIGINFSIFVWTIILPQTQTKHVTLL